MEMLNCSWRTLIDLYTYVHMCRQRAHGWSLWLRSWAARVWKVSRYVVLSWVQLHNDGHSLLGRFIRALCGHVPVCSDAMVAGLSGCVLLPLACFQCTSYVVSHDFSSCAWRAAFYDG